MADEQRDQSEAGQEEEEVLGATATPDASAYKVQPTSYEIPDFMQVRGEMPDNRFTEEVLAGSDEDTGEGEDAHPLENQPVLGISEDDDELPDTTGRAALKREKRSSSRGAEQRESGEERSQTRSSGSRRGGRRASQEGQS